MPHAIGEIIYPTDGIRHDLGIACIAHNSALHPFWSALNFCGNKFVATVYFVS
ncbi:MAG: hypothetical protein JWQ98_964 [Chlorobi bacterium]|nr:hypothetical protein [Chlorobiota bacterium]